jgi:hypothetical protein
VKYLLVVFWLTGSWPFSERIEYAHLGPYETILACQAASAQAEQVVTHLGAARVSSFCSSTKVK